MAERTRLIQARIRKGWTQKQAAGFAGVDIGTYRRWEKGEITPHPSNLRHLREAYGYTDAELLGFDHLGVSDSTPLQPSPAIVHTIPLLDVPASSYDHFRQRDLTLCLLSIADSCTPHDLTYQHIQGKVLSMLKDTSRNDDSISRREAVWRLAAFPLELYGIAAFGSASPVSVSKLPAEGVVAHCAAGVTACWNLAIDTKMLASATNTAIKYMRILTPIVTSVSQYRKVAADILVQCYLLRATYARLMEGSNDALLYIRKAEEYSKVSGDVVSRALTLRTLASAYSYANNWDLALQAGEQAQAVIEKAKVPALVASFIYAGLANYQAYHRQKQEALTSLGRAHATFFARSDNEDAVYVDHDQTNLLLNDGMTYFHLGIPKKAHDSFTQVQALSKTSVLDRIETTLNQVMTEVYRTDVRDMDYCVTHWTQGIEGAKAIRSDQRFSEAMSAYTAMRAAWPGEKRVQDLRDLAVHW